MTLNQVEAQLLGPGSAGRCSRRDLRSADVRNRDRPIDGHRRVCERWNMEGAHRIFDPVA